MKLDIFQKVWSQHKLRTAKHKSPLQLWITGMLTTDQVAVHGLTYADLPHNVLDEMGLSGFSGDVSAMHVELYDPDVPIHSEQLLLLKSIQ